MSYYYMKYLPLLGALLISTTAFAHNDDAYSHDAAIMDYTQTDWMARLPGNLPLSRLSIPGTHDSGSRHGGDAIANQVMTIPQQLNAGIRYLDIRVRHIDNAFAIHHGVKYQNLNFDDVMKSVSAFLQQHRGETVVMRLREEYSPSNNTRSISETMDSYISTYQNTFLSDYGYLYDPTLNQVRGKVFIIWDNFESTGRTPVASRRLNSIEMQDAWSLGSNWDLYGKWEKVKKFINDNQNYGDISINYLSAAGGSLPYFVASGHSSAGTSAPRLSTGLTTPGWKHRYPDFPRVSCFIRICTIAFEGTNTLTRNYLNNNYVQRTGIIAADFPGKGLIRAIINKNSF
jgi:Phosphatidylinositol-specific phospholipase C, X domain.